MSDPNQCSPGKKSEGGVVTGAVNGVVAVAGSPGVNVPLEGLLPTTPLLTIDEAAKTLRIGRSLAYQLAGDYIASGERSGLPCTRIGGCLRVPRWALLELVITGRVVTLHNADVSTVVAGTVTDEAGRDN